VCSSRPIPGNCLADDTFGNTISYSFDSFVGYYLCMSAGC
jgi:hypothetical protein